LQAEVKRLIMERFDIFAGNNGVQSPEETTTSNGHAQANTAAAVPSPPPSSSPVKRQTHSEEASEATSASPPPKKRKPDTDVDADALFAAKLQAEENMRARPTRGANTRRAAPSKKKSKAKTAKRVKAEDDSDVDSGSETKKEVNRTGGFHVSCHRRAPAESSANRCSTRNRLIYLLLCLHS
jgi:upstream activation factor subunit UAF30